MATLTVWKFDSAGGAQNALTQLERMQKEELIQINDGAYVYLARGQEEAEDRAAAQHDRRGRARRQLLGSAVRADLLRPAARHGGRRGDGRPDRLDDRRRHRRRLHPRGARAQVTPGTSALFVMTSNAVIDKVIEEFKDSGATLRVDEPVARAGRPSCARPSPTPSDAPALLGRRGPTGPRRPRSDADGHRPRLILFDEGHPMTSTTTARREAHRTPSRSTRPANGGSRAGKAARAEVPRESHAEFTAGPDRIDPVTLLEGQGLTRVPGAAAHPVRAHGLLVVRLLPRGGAADGQRPGAHAAVRTDRAGLRGRPPGELRGVRLTRAASRVRHQRLRRDRCPGPWEWDVKRLATSLEIAARSNGYPTKTRRGIVLAAVAAYRRAMRSFADMDALAVWYTHADMTQIEAVDHRVAAAPASARSWRATSRRRRRRTTSARWAASPPSTTGWRG